MGEMSSYFYCISDKAVPPAQQHSDDVGYDICVSEDCIINLGEFAILKTGLVVKPPASYYFELALRSSIPKKYGLLIPNGMGIIDPAYCGADDELGIQVYKFGPGKLDSWSTPEYAKATTACVSVIPAGTRVAQLILRKAIYSEFETFTPEDKNRGGFGSTG